MPDLTHPSASSAVLSRFLYSISHDIDILSAPLNGPQLPVMRGAGCFFFIPHRGIVNCPVKKHFKHLQQFEFAHDLDGTIHDSFALEEIPEIFLGQNDSLDDLTERNTLVGATGSNLAIAVLDIQFVLAQQPLAEMAIDFVDALPEFVGRNLAEVADLRISAHSLFKARSERIGMRFDQAHQ